MYKLGFEEAEEPVIKLPTFVRSGREHGKFQENIYFCFIDYVKTFDCLDHNKLWKIPKEMGVPDHLTCLLKSLYLGQKAAIRIRHGTTETFKTGKEA